MIRRWTENVRTAREIIQSGTLFEGHVLAVARELNLPIERARHILTEAVNRTVVRVLAETIRERIPDPAPRGPQPGPETERAG